MDPMVRESGTPSRAIDKTLRVDIKYIMETDISGVLRERYILRYNNVRKVALEPSTDMSSKQLRGPFAIYASDRPSGSRGGGRGWRHGRHGGGMGGRGLRAGRMLSAPDLQLIILALLEERPRHGYDLIKAIEELAGGAYVPSPGMVYPALNFLEESGQVELQQDGVKKRYRLTEAGLAARNESRARISTQLDALKRVGQRLGRAQVAYDADSPVAEPSPPAVLEAARRDLKAALFDSLDASPEEQQRIAEILQRTIVEIRKR